ITANGRPASIASRSACRIRGSPLGLASEASEGSSRRLTPAALSEVLPLPESMLGTGEVAERSDGACLSGAGLSTPIPAFCNMYTTIGVATNIANARNIAAHATAIQIATFRFAGAVEVAGRLRDAVSGRG